MPHRERNLVGRIAEIENLRDAYRKTSQNKRQTWGYLEFKEYAERNLAALREEILSGTYQQGEYRTFTIYEPKARLISALDFKDRVVQHALCNVIEPIFDKAMLPGSFACRSGRGTHAAVRHVQSRLRSTGSGHYLKTDFSKYFPSIDRAVLHRIIERKIGCSGTLGLIAQIIPAEGRGLPIGCLTSQLFANVYGTETDRFVHFTLGHRNWARYMDDIVVLGNDAQELRDSFAKIRDHAQEKLHLGISKWHCSPVSRGINFVGYRIWSGHKLLRKSSVTRAKQKISGYVAKKDLPSLGRFIASWSGHAQWADTHNLKQWMEDKYGITT